MSYATLASARSNARGRAQAQKGDSFDCGSERLCPVPTCDHYFGFVAYPLISEVKSDPRGAPVDKMLLAIADARLND